MLLIALVFSLFFIKLRRPLVSIVAFWTKKVYSRSHYTSSLCKSVRVFDSSLSLSLSANVFLTYKSSPTVISFRPPRQRTIIISFCSTNNKLIFLDVLQSMKLWIEWFICIMNNFIHPSSEII